MEKEVHCQLNPKKLRSREDKPTNSSIQCVIDDKMERLIEAGQKLGLDGQELREFVLEHDKAERQETCYTERSRNRKNKI